MKTVKLPKRILTVLVCMAFAFMSAVVPAIADSTKSNELVVGVPTDRCPVFYIDADTGEITGIGVDLMRTAAEEAGYTPVFVATEEETLKDALDNDKYDVLIPFGSAVPSTSGKATAVTENLMQTPFTLVTTGSRELPPLNELRVGMLSSLAAGAETVRTLYPRMDIVMYEDMDEAVSALRKGEVDALLHNSYVWTYFLQKPAYEDLEVQPSIMFSMDFRAGTPDTPEGRAVIKRLNSGIEKIDDTRRQAVILKHTSKPLYHYGVSDYLYKDGLIVLLGVMLFASIAFIAWQRVRTVRREHEEKLRELMDRDPLTGVLSMDGFRKRAEEILRANPDKPYFLSYNNIRDFKYINDSLGRDAGDELLKFWTKKTMENLSDDEAVGRIVADRFAVLRLVSSEEAMREDEVNVFEPVRNFFVDQGKETIVQIVSGIYVVTHDDFRDIDVDHMLDLASVAEKKIHDSRSINYAFYNPEQWEKGRLVADVVNYLPKAIQSDSLHVWYQPQVDYETGRIIGAEALCRWEHEFKGWLYPPEFIDILEESGLIYDLDRYIWDKVCQDLQRWNREGIHRSVSVNMSRCDVREDEDVVERFDELIKKYGLTADQIRVEITETAFAENPELLIRTTQRFHDIGVEVEMDDFGSGYSSLHMLKDVPVDRIKLDLLFLAESGDPEKGRTIVRHMIQLVDDLKISMIAEGVETADQAEFLKSNGCSDMQGYYFYKPMPVEEFESL